MPNYQFECEQGHSFQKFLPLTIWDTIPPGRKLTVPCETCGASAYQDFLPRGTDSTITPFVYYLNAAGEVRIPGSSRLPTPPGHTRCEATTLGELRHLESRCSREEQGKLSRRKEYQEAFESEEIAQNRRDLRSAMEQMSPAGREFARAAMQRNNQRRAAGYSHDLGFHFGILHNDER